MKTSKIAGFVFLALLWVCLCIVMLSRGGITLMNIFTVIASGIIIFVPLLKNRGKNNQNKQ